MPLVSGSAGSVLHLHRSPRPAYARFPFGEASRRSPCYIRISMNVSRFFFSYFWFSPRQVAREAIARK